MNSSHHYSPHLWQFAKSMRKNMTREERHLWFDFLRRYPLRIRRQVILGNYIVDFCCEKAQLIIEIDGSQHYTPEEKEKDRKRTNDLKDLGYKVIRISNRDVMTNFDGITQYIHQEIQKRLAQLS
ncbi:endonuclease domain-containing protein [Acidaminococcus fermentans]|uniref:endonuclease domain-containing protein n=2 Tax=Acidaminococcus TaxID=904 RepID=UPI00243286ED|nr:endonuclease domain-containing protein [Acidaminococcus fermentans]